MGPLFLAQQLHDAGADIQGMFTNDIVCVSIWTQGCIRFLIDAVQVGSSTADDGTTDPFSIRLFGRGMPPTDTATEATTRIRIGGENDSPARELVRFAAEVASNTITNMSGTYHYPLYCTSSRCSYPIQYK